MNSAISPVSRSGRKRSSKNELASSSVAWGSSRPSASASENGWMGSRGCPMTRVGTSNV